MAPGIPQRLLEILLKLTLIQYDGIYSRDTTFDPS